MSFLEEIVDSTAQAVEDRKSKRSMREMRNAVQPRSAERLFLRALQQPGISLIAEFKRTSPSDGARVRTEAQVEAYVDAYKQNGASALSILTEEHCFGGSLEDLRLARERTELPLLRKDFVIDEYQIYEAVEAGANAILLIAAVLEDDGKLAGLYGLAGDLGLDVLLEVRDHTELERALSLKADLIGINNRDLKTQPTAPRTFDVNIARTGKLFHDIPTSVTVVAESGLKTRAELDELEEIGVHAALIGSALMGANDVGAKCREFTQRPEASKGSSQTELPAFA